MKIGTAYAAVPMSFLVLVFVVLAVLRDSSKFPAPSREAVSAQILDDDRVSVRDFHLEPVARDTGFRENRSSLLLQLACVPGVTR